MSNDFYTEAGDPVTLNRGASSAIRNEYIKVRQGFDKLPTLVQIFGGSSNYVGLDGGSANAYSATGSSNIASYTDGLTVCFKVANSNTAGSTFNLNAIGAVSIVRPDGTALQANDLYAGQFATITYSTTASHWVLNHNSLASANAAATSASAASASASAASSSASAASSSASSASSSATASSGSATLASQWASTTGALVVATDYSAKEYAVGTFTRGTIGSAKDWATYTTGTVDASGYSAKEWALGIQTRGAANGGSSKDWATRTGGTVDNAEFSAKHYANLAAGYTVPFSDANALIKGGTDATKQVRFEVDGLTTATTRVVTVPDADLTLVGTGTIQTLTNKTFTGYTETVYALAGTDINPANGTVQTKTLAANTTFTESIADGQSVVLMLNPATFTTTWFSTTWVNAAGSGAAPTLKASAMNVIVFWQVGGVLYGNWIGSA